MNTSGGYTTLNAKTRFKKPITGRAIKKHMFARPDKSPGSRVSLTGRSINNSSIMTHYYTMKNNVAKLQFTKQLSQVDSNTMGGSGSSQSADRKSS